MLYRSLLTLFSNVRYQTSNRSFSHIEKCVHRRILELNRNYSDIKTNEELLFSKNSESTIPSVLKIKRAIKSAGTIETSDGFSCIQTKCPVCDREKKKTANDIFINKTSGKRSHFE